MKYDAALSKNKKSSEGNELFLYIKERKKDFWEPSTPR